MRSASPDFQRDVHCLLGLSIDAITLQQSAKYIRQAAFDGVPCFFSTPNLNFLIAAQRNMPFQQSVIRSDLSLADGMPIVWLAKLLSIPITERVAGSDVFDVLRENQGRKIKIFFFGGPPGIAERAMQVLNTEDGGFECVGFESPGFGTVMEMSAPETIARINASGAEFLMVSLGAVKGQAWIEHNLHVLTVPVVSHLGAVVNFVAGSVKRAPRWMQRTGLEWLWRVREEPTLWRRYWQDLRGLLAIILLNLPRIYLASALFRFSARTKLTISVVRNKDSKTSLILKGTASGTELSELREVLRSALAAGEDVSLDIARVRRVDSAFAGLLLLTKMAWNERGKQLSIYKPSWKVKLYLVALGIEKDFFAVAEN